MNNSSFSILHNSFVKYLFTLYVRLIVYLNVRLPYKEIHNCVYFSMSNCDKITTKLVSSSSPPVMTRLGCIMYDCFNLQFS